MSKSIYVQYLTEQPNANLHFLNRLIKTLNHFIDIEPSDKPNRVRVSSHSPKVLET